MARAPCHKASMMSCKGCCSSVYGHLPRQKFTHPAFLAIVPVPIGWPNKEAQHEQRDNA